MSYPKGTNTANFNNCSIWGGQNGNVTAVGKNGGPSAYGTYDQAGNISEWVDDFYTLGGSYASSGSLLSINSGLSTTSATTRNNFIGFRLAGLNYSNVYILFNNPFVYIAGQPIQHSFSIVNEDPSPVSVLLDSFFSKNISSVAWTAIYPSGSSGPISGSSLPSGSITVGANSTVVINIISQTSPSTKGNAFLSAYISLTDNTAPPLISTTFSSQVLIKTASCLNYETIFSNFLSEWSPSAPNSFLPIGDAGNLSDSQWGSFLGSVAYNYLMTKYEITNIEYCYFLNSVDPEGLNPAGIYSSNMGSTNSLGGILFNNSNSNGSKYILKARMGNKPVNFINWWCAARFCNWLHNGALQYSVTDTTTAAPQNSGAYSVGISTAGSVVAPNPDALFTIPTFNEWIKAAHYKGNATNSGYWNYPTRTNTQPSQILADIITGSGRSNTSNNTANIKNTAAWDPISGESSSSRVGPTTVGTNGVSSAYELFDMVGNLSEITVSSNVAAASLKARGGNYADTQYYQYDLQYQFSNQPNIDSSTRSSTLGFRIVSLIRGDMLISIIPSDTSYSQNTNIDITINITNQSNYSISNNSLSINIFGPTFDSVNWLANYPVDSFGPISGTSSNITDLISMGPNETISFVFSVKPSALSINSITINASITPSIFFTDINSNNNSASLVIPVKPTDISVSIDGPLTYAQSVPSTYTMTVKNLSTTYVSGVNVGLATSGAALSSLNWTALYSLASGSLSGTGSVATQLAIFPSGEAIYTINMTPSSTTISNLVLRATANVPSGIGISDSNLVNNTGVLSASIIPTDLSTEIILDQYYTQNVTSNISVLVSNTGQFSPSGTLSVVFSGVPQSSILWSGVYSPGSLGAVSGSGNIITSGLSIPNSGNVLYNIRCTPPTNTISPISCSVVTNTRSPLFDSQISNNTAVASMVLSPSDIGISSSGVQYYENNAAIDYSFTITNNSTNAINGIVVNIPVPNNISNQRWLATYINGSGVDIGSGVVNESIYLASSGSVVFGFDAIAGDNFITPISCTGSVSMPNISGVIDPILFNNSSTISIPHALLIQDVRSSASTCDNNGSITVVLAGGIPPFRYTLGSIFVNSSDSTYKFDNLEPSTYNITVIDSTSNIASLGEDIVIEDSNIAFILNNIYPPTLLDSFAKIDLTVVGKGPFDLIFTNNETLSTIEIPAFETRYIYDITDDEYRYVIDDLIVPGSYTLSILSHDTCSLSQGIVVPNITPISVNVSVVPDEPITINAPAVSLGIYDTLLIPYKHIQDNSNLWNIIKDFNIKDNIYLWVNNERYEYKVVRTMLDKYCLNENKIEILKLGNSYEDWYFYLYIAPSINLSTNPELISAALSLGQADGAEKYPLVLGLDDSGHLEKDRPSLIRGSIIINGIAFPDIISGFGANLSIGVNEVGLGYDDFELKNIRKTQLTNIYAAGVVTAFNFLENFNVLNEYVNISQTTCNTSQEDYEYLINTKNVLLAINNINNIDNIYLFNNSNTIHTGQANCFASINTPMITELGNIENSYTTDYFTFNKDSTHISKFIINNQEVTNVGVISGIDSRYIIARIIDKYNNRPKSIIYETGTTVAYDEHFVQSQQIIQSVNSNVLHDFIYGDILIYVPPSTQPEENLFPDPNPTPPITATPTPTPIQTTPIIEMSKDNTNTGSLQINVFPLNTKCILYGPQKYERVFVGAVVFINMVPGVYKIVGDSEDLRNKNLYQNEYRIIIDKNSVTAQTVEFFSYANRLFISEKDH